INAVTTQIRDARNAGEIVQVVDGAVRIQHHVRDVSARVGKMRRVAEVERLQAELKPESLRQPELAVKSESPVYPARAAHGPESGVPEARLGYGSECQWVEVGHVAPDIAKLLDSRLHLIGALGRVRKVERRAGSRDGEWCAAVEAPQLADLPAAEERCRRPAAGQPLPLTERQLPYLRDVEHVRAVVVGQDTIQSEIGKRLDEIRTAVGVDVPADDLRPRIASLHLQALREAAR